MTMELVGWVVGKNGGGILHASKYTEHEAHCAGYPYPVYRIVSVDAAQNPVGEAAAMPGTNGGFTMATFRATDVPIGCKLFAAAPQQKEPWTDEQMVRFAWDMMIRQDKSDSIELCLDAFRERESYRGNPTTTKPDLSAPISKGWVQDFMLTINYVLADAIRYGGDVKTSVEYGDSKARLKKFFDKLFELTEQTSKQP